MLIFLAVCFNQIAQLTVTFVYAKFHSGLK